jgi:hypothetical protein
MAVLLAGGHFSFDQVSGNLFFGIGGGFALSSGMPPLANYPGVIATLIRQRTIKIVKRELAAKGVRIWDVTSCELARLAEAYFESHRAELIRVAIDTIRTAASLQQLAESEARRRAKARAALSREQGKICASH